MTDRERYEIALMQHATAWPKKYRNFFCAEPTSLDDEVWKGLVSQGQARLFRVDQEAGNFYCLTDAGFARLEAAPCQS